MLLLVLNIAYQHLVYLPALEAVPDGFVIIICAVCASVVMSIVSPLPGDEIDASADTKDGGNTEGSEVMGDA